MTALYMIGPSTVSSKQSIKVLAEKRRYSCVPGDSVVFGVCVYVCVLEGVKDGVTYEKKPQFTCSVRHCKTLQDTVRHCKTL